MFKTFPRVKHEDLRRVGGFDVLVKSIQEMNYDGEMESQGFEVCLGLKKIAHFWGWPTDSDIKKVIDKL